MIPEPKSMIVVTGIDGDWVVSDSSGIAADGKQISYANRNKFDGKEFI
jgi:hypothetical protein